MKESQEWGVFPVPGRCTSWKAAGEMPGDLVVAPGEGLEHCWGDDPAFAAVEKDRLGDGLVEQSHDAGW